MDCNYLSKFPNVASATDDVHLAVDFANTKFPAAVELYLFVRPYRFILFSFQDFKKKKKKNFTNINLYFSIVVAPTCSDIPTNYPCSLNYNISYTLDLFTAYRQTFTSQEAIWVKMTTCFQ